MVSKVNNVFECLFRCQELPLFSSCVRLRSIDQTRLMNGGTKTDIDGEWKRCTVEPVFPEDSDSVESFSETHSGRKTMIFLVQFVIVVVNRIYEAQMGT